MTDARLAADKDRKRDEMQLAVCQTSTESSNWDVNIGITSSTSDTVRVLLPSFLPPADG